MRPEHRPQLIMLIACFLATSIVFEFYGIATLTKFSQFDIPEEIRTAYLERGIVRPVRWIVLFKLLSVAGQSVSLLGLWLMRRWSVALLSAVFFFDIAASSLEYSYRGLFFWWANIMVLGIAFYNYSEME